MRRQYTIQGSYRDPHRDEKPLKFVDKVEARCAEQAFNVWEQKHTQKPLLRFHAIEPLF